MMKKIIYIIVSVGLIGFFSCKKVENLVPEFEVKQISFNQAELISAFAGLTNNDESACNVITNPQEIPEVLCRIVSDAKEGSEIIFMVDKTGSMADDIDEVKKNINKIIDCLPQGCRLGAATYGDYFEDNRNWFDYAQLTESYNEIRTYINDIRVTGGGDIPESVYDGIFEVLEVMEWKDCDAPDKIIVMGDAPPKTASGTNHSLDEVLEKTKSICSDTEFFPVIVLDL